MAGTPAVSEGLPRKRSEYDHDGGHPIEILGVPARVVLSGSREQRAAAIAAAQRGVLSREQLRQAGIPDRAITRMAAAGRLHRLHPGVFAFGHTILPDRGREVAALLALGANAVLSHWTACAWWQLLPPRTDSPWVDVLINGRPGTRRQGIRVHETTFLEPRDVRHKHGLPITSPARTLLDLADVLTGRQLERALDEAVARRITRRSQLEDVVARANGRHGAKRLAPLIQDAGRTRTHSRSEEHVLDLFRRAQLPPPVTNEIVHGFSVDFYWHEHRLALEMDSFQWHIDRGAFENDRRKTATLTAAGLRLTRSTWEQADEEPLLLVAQVAQALSRAGPSA